jgi:Protein of unknown function (DUF3071)
VRRLEVVAVSDDGTYVLLATARDSAHPTHSVRIDGRLHAAVRGKLDDSVRRESELSPKEIQARLRAGDAPEQVAKAAKVPVSRVMRYAGPVISERERIVDQARAAVMQRSRGPAPSVPLGLAAEKRLASTAGLRPDTVSWTARRRDDGAWVVSLGYVAKGGSRTATWLWQPAGRALTSLNSLGARLGADEVAATPRRKRAAPTRTTAKRAAAASSRQTPTSRQAAEPPPAAVRSPAKSANGRATVPSWSDVLLGVQSPPAARGRRRS